MEVSIGGGHDRNTWKLSSGSFSSLGKIRSRLTGHEARGKRYSRFDAGGTMWLFKRLSKSTKEIE